MSKIIVLWLILGITLWSIVCTINLQVEESNSGVSSLYSPFCQFIGTYIHFYVILKVCAECGTELIKDDESLLFLTTLDGTFLGVNIRNGKILWKFKEGKPRCYCVR